MACTCARAASLSPLQTHDDWVVVRRYMTFDEKREEVEDKPKALKKAA
jgi:hypothetical protein